MTLEPQWAAFARLAGRARRRADTDGSRAWATLLHAVAVQMYQNRYGRWA